MIPVKVEDVTSFFSGFKDLRDNEELCDFRIIIDETVFHCHKVVLAAQSDYFRKMFSHDTTESNKELAKYKSSDIDVEIMKIIVNFCYTFEVNINEDNIKELVATSTYLQIKLLYPRCEEYIKRNLNYSNYLSIFQLANAFPQHDKLADLAARYCAYHFKDILKRPDFIQMGAVDLSRILKSDYLSKDYHEMAFEESIKWINHDLGERSKHIDLLMGMIHFESIDIKRLVEFSKDPIIRNNPVSRALLEDAKDEHVIRLSEKFCSRCNMPKSRRCNYWCNCN